MRTLLAMVILALITTPTARAQTKTPESKELLECRAEVERLKVENYDLQRQLNEAMKRAGPSSAADPGLVEAVSAIKAARSVLEHGIDVRGGYVDWKPFFLDAKVKVDLLPASPSSQPVRDAFDVLAWIDTVWSNSLGKGGTPRTFYDALKWSYPDLERQNPELERGPAANLGVVPLSVLTEFLEGVLKIKIEVLDRKP